MKARTRRASLFLLLPTSLLLLSVVSSVVGTRPAGATTPNAPTDVTVSYSSPSSGTVTWGAPAAVSGVTITGYVVTSSPSGLTCSLPATATTLSCEITGLTAATSYTFSVVAWSAGGTGPSASSSPSTSPSLSSTSTTLSVLPLSPENLGTAVTLTAAVTSGTTGTVAFKSGGTTITGCASRVVTAGFARCTTESLASGTDSLTAVYSGDGNYATSTSSAVNYTISSSTLVEPTSPLVITSTSSPFNSTLTLTTSGGSGSGAISYSVVNGTATGCSISGVYLSLPTNVSGTCLVTATQASSGSYLAQSSNVTTVNFFWEYATYPYNYYYCGSGATLSGDTCTHLESEAGASEYSGYYCPSGWSGPSGTTCYRFAGISHAACNADGGSWLGSECELYTPASYGTDGGAFGYYCPSGWSGPSGGECYEYGTYFAYVGTSYSCPYGGSLGGSSGLTCEMSGGSGPNVRLEKSDAVGLLSQATAPPKSTLQFRVGQTREAQAS